MQDEIISLGVMDTQEKERLIKAINSKGLRNSLISIYYNIGRVLPFRAQRFPDGRVSDWYRSQFVDKHLARTFEFTPSHLRCDLIVRLLLE